MHRDLANRYSMKRAEKSSVNSMVDVRHPRAGLLQCSRARQSALGRGKCLLASSKPQKTGLCTVPRCSRQSLHWTLVMENVWALREGCSSAKAWRSCIFDSNSHKNLGSTGRQSHRSETAPWARAGLLHRAPPGIEPEQFARIPADCGSLPLPFLHLKDTSATGADFDRCLALRNGQLRQARWLEQSLVARHSYRNRVHLPLGTGSG
jgi:hypothetical protein